MPATSRRTSHFTESVIRRMTRVANACGAINLSQGFPDFDPPAELQAALERVSRAVGVAAVPGSSFFREKVQHLIRFHFAKREETLREATRRLADLRRHATSATKWPLACHSIRVAP